MTTVPPVETEPTGQEPGTDGDAVGSGDISDELPGGESDTDAPLEKDVIFGTLKNARRRAVLRYLRAEGGRSTLRNVSEHVAALENGITVQAITSKQRKRVYVSLYQVHLPGMDRDDSVAFNQARGTIELTPRADEVLAYLDRTGARSTSQQQYITVTGVGGLLYLFGSVLLGPGSVFVTLTVVGLLVTLLGLGLYDGLVRRSGHTASPDLDTRLGSGRAGGLPLGDD